jgi:3-deoxy-D-arabino-heptulosonate 7-phosphate (DAHP) synthase class II
MGAHSISSKLKHLIDLKLKHNLNFLFMSDPMHGNTYESKEEKLKIRHYDHILS